MTALVSSGVYDVALGSRILGKGALSGGMPMYKYVANRFLTAFENFCLGQKLSEYHTGYRVFSKTVLQSLDFSKYSDDFIFDNQILVHAQLENFKIGEISVPAKYFKEASSINFRSSIWYGIGVVGFSLYGLFIRVKNTF